MATEVPERRSAALSLGASAPAARSGGALVMWVRRHPVAAYLAWFYPVVWAISFIPTVLARNVVQVDPPFWVVQLFIIAATLLGIFLPAVVITWLVDGPAGLRALFESTVRVRAAAGWYAVALFGLAAPATLLAVILYGPPAMTTATLLTALMSGFVVQSIIGFATNNLWEEVGVMGFLQARLQTRHGALLGALITAPLFALQHLALFLGDGIGPALGILALAIAVMFPFRALLGWMYNRTGSLFLVGLLHATGNAAASGAGFGDSFLRLLYPTESVGSLHVLASVVVGLTVIVATHGRLGLPPRPARRAPAVAPSVARTSDAGATQAR